MDIALNHTLCTIYICIIWLLYTPICLYGIYKLFTYRRNIVLFKRHSMIPIYSLICMLFLLSIFIPFTMISFSNLSLVIINNHYLTWNQYGIYSLYPTTIFILQNMYIFIWRQWLYYLDVLRIKSTSNREWIEIIRNPNLSYACKPFSASNLSKHHIFHKTMCILLFITASSIICWTLFHQNTHIFRIGTYATCSFWTILCCIFMVILFCKTPKFEDSLFIRQEITYWIYIMFCVAMIIIFDLFVDYVQSSHQLHDIMTLTHYFIICSAICLMICISSYCVLYANKYWIIVMDTNANDDDSDFIKTTQKMLSLSQCIPSHRYSQTDTNTMLNVLQNSVLFDQFMGHLMKEFSVEIMLSLIELSQFQQSVFDFADMIREFEYNDNMVVIDADWRIKMNADCPIYPSSIPNSSIVYDELNKGEFALCQHLGMKNNSISEDITYSFGAAINVRMTSDESNINIEDVPHLTLRQRKSSSVNYSTEIEIKKIEFLIRSHKLYTKYIENGSVLEINLSKRQKEYMRETMRGFNEWVNIKDRDGTQLKMLFKLFEKAMEEMFTMLNSSFIRFKSKYSLTDFTSRSPIAF